MIRRSFVKSGIAALVALQLGTVIFLTAGATLIGVGMASLLSNKKKQDYRKATVVKSVCLSCSTVCGIEGFVIDGKVVQIRDNPLDPNMGSYMPCAKGQSGPSINDYPERLLSPLKRVGQRGDGLWKHITWDEACADIFSRIQRSVDGGHPERVAWHQGRSRIDAEINRFLNAIGTPVQPDHRALCSANKRAANYVGLGYTDWESIDAERVLRWRLGAADNAIHIVICLGLILQSSATRTWFSMHASGPLTLLLSHKNQNL